MLKMIDLRNTFKLVSRYAQKRSPEILTAIGVAGMAMSVVFAITATPKALQHIEKEKDEKKTDDLSKTEIVKATWKCYVPAAVTFAASTACIVGASKINFERNAALATAYTLSETAMMEYKKKVIEEVGKEKENDIQTKATSEKIEGSPSVINQMFVSGGSDVRCYDELSNTYFLTTVDKLDKAVNELNRRMRDENYISLNDFYYEVGIEPNGLGDMLGWNIDDGYIKLQYTAHLDKSGNPCLAFTHITRPIPI